MIGGKETMEAQTLPRTEKGKKFNFIVHTKGQINPLEIERLIEDFLKRKYNFSSYVEFTE